MDGGEPRTALLLRTARSDGADRTGVAVLGSVACHSIGAVLLLALSLTRVPDPSVVSDVTMVFEQAQPAAGPADHDCSDPAFGAGNAGPGGVAA